jgi:hypothetical protein
VLYHPTFLYESLWNLALGIALLVIGKRLGLRYGRLFALYVAGYTLGRFWIEGLRIDPVGGVDHAVEFLGLRINQYTAIVLFVGAVIYFWATRNKTGEEIVVSPGDADPAHPSSLADPEHEVATSSTPAADTSEEEGERPASEPAEPVKPAESVKSVEPAEPVEPVKSVESVKPVKPTEPVEPVKSAEPVKPVESVKSVESEPEVKAEGVPEEKNSR